MRHLPLATLLLAGACGMPAADREPTSEVARQGTSPPPSHDTVSALWPGEVGSFLAVENTSKGEALLLRRDTTEIPVSISVVGYDAVSTSVTLRDVRAVPCASRALLRVQGAPNGWSLALDTQHAKPVQIDALEDLSHADSQRVVVRIQHALNALPDIGAAQEFHGLPVVVRDAWLVRLPTGPTVVARAARLRNLEATAHEELRFVVLEGDQPRYVARVAGDEEAVESWDLLAALLTDHGPLLAVAREGPRSLQIELVALEGSAWRSIWRSDGLACPTVR
jgi:hypothetical protein